MENKIKFCRQVTDTECGLCCVSMILSYYKTIQPLSYYREKVSVGRDGISIVLIVNLLQTENFSSNIFESSKYEFSKKPVIAFSEKDNHYVVIKKDRNHVMIFNPEIGKYKVSFESFRQDYDYIIECEPNSQFIPTDNKENEWRNFIPLIVNQKRNLTILAILSTMVYIISTSITYAMQKAIDGLNNNQLFENMWIIYVPIIVTLLFVLLSYLRNKILIVIEVELDNDLNLNTFEKILKLPFSFFNSRGSSELLYRLTLLQSIRQIISNGVVNVIIDGGMLVFLLIYSFYLNVLYSFILMVIIVITLFYIIIINKKILAINQKSLSSQSSLMAVEIELMTTLEYIKSTGNEKFVLNKFSGVLNNVLRYFKKSEKLLFTNTLVLDTLSLMAPFILFFNSLYFGISNNNTLGEKITLYMISSMVISKSTTLFQNFTNFEIMKTILERLNDIYDAKNEEINEKGIMITKIEKIQFSDVSFEYSGAAKQVLKNISFELMLNSRIAFVGPSGSGKSTITKLISSLYSVGQGSVKINGIPMEDININSLRKNINLIPQSYDLLDDTIKNNITLDREVTEYDLNKAISISNLKEDIEKFPLGLNTKISNIANNISGGQKQRVLIARAILNQGSLMILDEATSSLDYITEREIVKKLKDISEMQIIVAHRLSTIIDVDVIYYLEDGEIKESGSHEQLINKKGLYYKMYNSQKKEGI